MKEGFLILINNEELMSYDLFLSRDYMIFSSAHFVVGEKFIESLHGHNYKILINIYGDQDEENMILNFYDIKKVLKPIVDSLDHKILIPEGSNLLEITESGEQIVIKIPSYNKEYEFPKSDVMLLPIKNTTVEEISHYLAEKLMWNNEIKKKNIDQVTVTVFEYEGQGVTYELFPRY